MAVIVTPWGFECGLATYAEHLVEAIGRGTMVAAETVPAGLSEQRTLPAIPNRRCWSRGSFDYEKLLAYSELDGGLVHFNHE